MNLLRFFSTWRLDRIAMLSAVTAATAWGFGAAPCQTGLAAIFGACLCGAGFFLDYLVDADKDRASGRLTNPVAYGRLSARGAVVLVGLAAAAAAGLAVFLNPWMLLPLAGVLILIGLEAAGVLENPYGRAASLGLLQAMYALSGSLAGGAFHPSILWICLYLFFAMAGGRALGDLRDLEHDRLTGLQTLPIRYGVRFTLGFLFVFETAAYLAGAAATVLGGFGLAWLYSVALTAMVGTFLNVYVAVRPVPSRARRANNLSLMILGSLYVAGMLAVRA